MNQSQFQDIESELNLIAATDRSRASANFESRILESVMSEVRCVSTEPVIATIRPSAMQRAPVRIAAAIAIVGGIAAAFLANEGRNTRVNEESVALMMSDVETILAIAAELDDGSSDELAILHSETTMLRERVRGGISDLIDEGAM